MAEETENKKEEKETTEEKQTSVSEKPTTNSFWNKGSGFARGAIMGGIAGFLITMATTRKRVIIWSVIGAVGGGYIGHRIAEASDPTKQIKFNFNGAANKKRKFKTSK